MCGLRAFGDRSGRIEQPGKLALIVIADFFDRERVFVRDNMPKLLSIDPKVLPRPRRASLARAPGEAAVLLLQAAQSGVRARLRSSRWCWSI